MLKMLDKNALLDLIRKTFPPWWVEAMLSGDGGEILHALARVGERLSEAVMRAVDGLTPGKAGFGRLAHGRVRLRLDSPHPESRRGLVLPAGTTLWDVHGETVRTMAEARWEADDRSPRDVPVESERPSYQANLAPGTVLVLREIPGATEAPDAGVWGEVLPPGLSGGAAPCLETLADQRALGPAPGESEASLRLRLRTLDDVVTPAAMRRAIRAIVPDARLIEAWDVYAFADTGLWCDGAWSLAAPTGLHSRTYDGHATAWFAIWIPPPKVGLEELQWLYADYGHTDYQDGACAAYLGGLMPGGEEYDVGGYGVRPEVAALSQRVNTTRPAGVHWIMEEG